MIVEDELKKEGAEVIRVRVGDVFVCEEIKRHGAMFAMEISAHFFLPQYYIFDDPILTTAKLMEILGMLGKPLSELVDAIPSYPFVEEGFPCPDDLKFKVNDMLLAHFRKRGAKVDTTDGVKVIYKDGWAMLRPSNTQPLTRLFAEARTKKRLEQLVREFKKLFNDTLRKAGGTPVEPEQKPKPKPKPKPKAPEPKAKKATAKPAARAAAKPPLRPAPKPKPTAKPTARPTFPPKAKPKPKARPMAKPKPRPRPKAKPKPRPKPAPKAAKRKR
jgi:hypothetical protein